MKKNRRVPKKILLSFILIISFSTQAKSEWSANPLLYGTWKPVSFINFFDELEEYSYCDQSSRFTFYKNGDFSHKDVWEYDGKCLEDLEEGIWINVGSSRYAIEITYWNEHYEKEITTTYEVRITFSDKNTMKMVSEEGGIGYLKRVS